jgi:hypothetical protein
VRQDAVVQGANTILWLWPEWGLVRARLGSGFMVQGSESMVHGSGFRVYDLWFVVQA